MDTSRVLPNELWDDILGYVTKRDLKTLRLAGRWHLADLASPKLFTTAYIAARRGVIDALAGLASHSVLRHHVKTFVYDSSYLDPEIYGELSGNDWSNAGEAVHGDKALALAFAHQEYIRKYELRPALEQAFDAFPNIEKIVYADMARTACLPGDTLGSAVTSFLDSTVTSLLGSNHPHLRRLLTGKFRKRVFKCCLTGECMNKHLNFYRRQYGGLAILLEVMDVHELDSLSELSFGSSAAAPSTAAGIPCFFLDKNARTFPHLLHSVWRLRKLDLTLCFPSLQQGPLRPDVGLSTATRGLDYAGLKRLLEYAEQLEELHLSGEVDVATLSLENFWPDQTLASLKTLHLRTTEATYAKLSSLIWCNRHTLRHLQLDDFNLVTEGWPSISNFIQQHAPNLNVVYGYTWFQSITRSITWSSKDVSASTDSFDSDVVADGVEEEDDPEDGSYSDGSDFEITEKIVGYQPKAGSPGDLHTNDSEYDDVFKVVKTLKVESDTESFESDSDDAPLNYETYYNRGWALKE